MKIPVAEKFNTKIFNRALQKHIKRQVTLMKNIRVEFQILIGSFKMSLTPELLRKLTKASKIAPTQPNEDESVRHEVEFNTEDLTIPADASNSSDACGSPAKLPPVENLDE